jgi:hypothetical protein
MDGGELAERARDLDPRLLIVLMVGLRDPHVDDLVAGYHYLPFIAKPVDFADLAGMLHDLLGPAPGAPTEPPSMWRSKQHRGSGQHRG